MRAAVRGEGGGGGGVGAVRVRLWQWRRLRLCRVVWVARVAAVVVVTKLDDSCLYARYVWLIVYG